MSPSKGRFSYEFIPKQARRFSLSRFTLPRTDCAFRMGGPFGVKIREHKEKCPSPSLSPSQWGSLPLCTLLSRVRGPLRCCMVDFLSPRFPLLPPSFIHFCPSPSSSPSPTWQERKRKKNVLPGSQNSDAPSVMHRGSSPPPFSTPPISPLPTALFPCISTDL